MDSRKRRPVYITSALARLIVRATGAAMSKEQRPQNLVIFDCDGVLIDSEVILAQAYSEGLAGLGFVISPEEIITGFTGVPDPEMFDAIGRQWQRPVPAEFASAMKPTIDRLYRSELQAIDGIAQALDSLEHPICVASSSSPEKIELGLQLVGLHDRFAPHIFSASQVARGKPTPDLFLFAAENMGFAPAKCLVIEDSLAGVQAARAAEMIVLGFTGGSHCPPGHGQHLLDAGVAEVICEMSGLVEAIERNLPA